MTFHQTSRRCGVSPVTLIVVLALLLLLLALLAPAVNRVRDAAARMQSQNNLKQLALAVHNHHDAFNGMPPVVGQFANKTGSLHFFLLPFIEWHRNGARPVFRANGDAQRSRFEGIVIDDQVDGSEAMSTGQTVQSEVLGPHAGMEQLGLVPCHHQPMGVKVWDRFSQCGKIPAGSFDGLLASFCT